MLETSWVPLFCRILLLVMKMVLLRLALLMANLMAAMFSVCR